MTPSSKCETGGSDPAILAARDQIHRANRGQLLLVTAIGLAVLFVTLATIMNTAIYTENLATRGSDTAGTLDAKQHHDAVNHGIATVLTHVNENNTGSHSTLAANLTAGTERWASISSDLYVTSGSGVHIALNDTTNGTRIDQDVSWRTFTNESGSNSDWTLASDVERTRKFRMNVTDDSLATSGSGEFRVLVDNGTDTWRMNVTQDGADIVVGIEDGTGAEGTCRVTGNFVWINMTAGTVGDDECDPLTFAEPLTGTYRIEYHNPTNASGTYQLIVDNASLASNPAPHFNDDSTGISPYVTPAIYSAQITVDYQTNRLYYSTTIRLAPGEPE